MVPRDHLEAPYFADEGTGAYKWVRTVQPNSWDGDPGLLSSHLSSLSTPPDALILRFSSTQLGV